MTTESPESGTAPRSPSRIRQDNAKSQLPYVDPVVVGLRPPCHRHGQIASQLHASKYVPETPQSPIGGPRPAPPLPPPRTNRAAFTRLKIRPRTPPVTHRSSLANRSPLTACRTG